MNPGYVVAASESASVRRGQGHWSSGPPQECRALEPAWQMVDHSTRGHDPELDLPLAPRASVHALKLPRAPPARECPASDADPAACWRGIRSSPGCAANHVVRMPSPS